MQSEHSAAQQLVATSIVVAYTCSLFSCGIPGRNNTADAVESDRQSLAPPVGYGMSPPEVFTADAGVDPVVVGDINAEFNVNPSGESTISVPIWTPPGRMGMAPRLSLEYRSRGGNGPLGVGWTLAGLSTITRCTPTLATDGFSRAIDFTNGDTFCLDGERLVPISGINGANLTEYRTQRDSYRKIVSHGTGPAYFEVRQKDGTIYYFGKNATSAGSRLEGARTRTSFESGSTDLPTTTTLPVATLAWSVDRIEDRLGNFVSISYVLDSTGGAVEQLADEIKYTGFGTSKAPTRFVKFNYASRPDVDERFVAGLKAKQTKRLTQIVVSGPTGLSHSSYSTYTGVLKTYDLAYQVAGVTGRSLLSEISECAGTACKAPLKFGWEQGELSFEHISTSIASPYTFANPQFPGSSERAADYLAMQVADLNGDGLDDILYRKADLTASGDLYINSSEADGGGTPQASWYFRLSNGSGFGPETHASSLPYSAVGNETDDPRILDMDGNGTGDAFVMQHANHTLGQSAGYRFFTFGTSNFSLTSVQNLEASNYWWDSEKKTLLATVADLDGDGRPDFARQLNTAAVPYAPQHSSASMEWAYRLNQSSPTSVAFDQSYTSFARAVPNGGTATVDSRVTHPTYVAEVNGDGRMDLLVRLTNPDVLNGQSQVAADNASAQFFAVSVGPGGGTIFSPTALSGLPKQLSHQLHDLQAPGPGAATYQRRWFLDLNGDALSDTVSAYDIGEDEFGASLPATAYVSFNTGAGFTRLVEQTSVATPDTRISPARRDFNDDRPWEMGIRIADINSDGKDDVLLADDGAKYFPAPAPRSTWIALLSTGSSTGPAFTKRDLGVPLGAPATYPFAVNPFSTGYGFRLSRLGDINGDGLVDIIQVRRVSSLPPALGVLEIYKRKGNAPDMITKMSGGLQTPSIDIKYRPVVDSSVYTPGSALVTYPQRRIRRGLWVVSETKIDAGLVLQLAPVRNTITYRYEDGRVDLKGHGWLGFSKQVIEEPERSTRTTREFNLTQTALLPGGGYVYPLLGLPTKTTIETDLRLTANTSGEARRSEYVRNYSVRVGTTTEPLRRTYAAELDFADLREREGTVSGTAAPVYSNLLRHVRVDEAYDDFGNLTSRKQEASPAEIGTGGAVEITEVSLQYTNTPSTWIVGRPHTIVTTSTAPALGSKPSRSVARTVGQTWNPTTGLLETATVEPGATKGKLNEGVPELYSKVTLGRDPYGNVSSVIAEGSGQTRTVTTTYDSLDHTLPETITNSQFSETTYFLAGFGLPAVFDDRNDVRTTTFYDTFGRVVAADLPDVSQPFPTVLDDDLSVGYSAENIGSGLFVRVRTKRMGEPTVDRFFDQLGRQVRERIQNADGKPVNSDTSYDRFGRTTYESLPYESSGRPEYYRFGYDALGRMTSLGRPDSVGTAIKYEGLKATHTDESWVSRHVEVDALGRVVKLATISPDTSTEIVTKIEYGPFDVVEATVDPEGNRTTATYDVLGRVTTTNEPNSGLTTTAYNAFGAIKDSTDANQELVEYSYDDLGRLTTVESGGVTDSWTYDTAPNGVGGLASATSRDGVALSYSYDSLGRLSSVDTTAGGTTSSVSYTYDSYGRVEFVSYPQVGAAPRFSVKHTYTASGYLKNIEDVLAQKILWRATARDAAGRPTFEEYGNGLTTRRSYDREGRIKFIETKLAQGSATPVQKLGYTYGLDGRLDTQSDRVAESTEDFEYDFLRRLSKWTVYQNCTKSETNYGYTDAGNLLSATVLSGFGASLVNAYDKQAKGPHAVSTTTIGSASTSFTYDARGNQKTGFGRTAEWNFFGLPSRIYDTANDVSFQYDAFRNRTVKQNTNGNQTLSVDGLYERRLEGGVYTHIFRVNNGSREVAQQHWVEQFGTIASSTTYYEHDDRLGSTNVITSSNGTVVARHAYDPFGSRRFERSLATEAARGHGAVKTGFTGHEPDDEFRLINMRGRLYDPRNGRFLSPDPFARASPGGQGFNRYSYAVNNPIGFIDPSGFTEEPVGEIGHPAPSSSPGMLGFEFDVSDLFKNDLWDTVNSAVTSVINKATAPSAAAGSADANGSYAGDGASGSSAAGDIAKGVLRGAFNFSWGTASPFFRQALTGEAPQHQFLKDTARAAINNVQDWGVADGMLMTYHNLNPVTGVVRSGSDFATAVQNGDRVAIAAGATTLTLAVVSAVVLKRTMPQGAATAGPSIRSRLRDAGLPGGSQATQLGPFRFRPRKGYRSGNPLPRDGDGYVDRFGNVWKEGPYHGDPAKGFTFEWDVQLSPAGRQHFKQFGIGDKGYINVAPDGTLSH